MTDEFIQGNTSKKVIVSNKIDESINISWYLDNPSQDLIRENKTLIPSLSWVNIEPEWKIIPPNGSHIFYIYLEIPQENKNLNKYWEVWPVFKQEETELFNWEHAIRLYIDTPRALPETNEDENLFSFFSQNSLLIFLLIVIFISFAISLFILKYRFKKNKQ
jgi:hypothetical protein